MAIAGICVFMMLVPKPIILALKAKSKASTQKKQKVPNQDMSHSVISIDVDRPLMDSPTDSHVAEHDDGGHEENFGELMIHQMIETIEFVLGSISNTASYLRLWALSLAHSQLAHVFLDMIMSSFYKTPSNGIVAGIMMVPAFFFLAIVTIAVLMVMDVMECFLHTLRLHWVEF